MRNTFKEILKKIKENDKIVIARHIGADPDALGSTLGLKEAILNTLEYTPTQDTFLLGKLFKINSFNP